MGVIEMAFEGRPVRLVTRDEEVLVPLPDIARALDYNKEALWRVIERSADVFEQGIVVTTIPSEGGPQETTCLTRDGVVGLLMKLSTGRIRDAAKRRLVVNFQRWAIQTIREVAEGTYRAADAREIEEMARLIGGFQELQRGFLQTLRVFGDIMKRYDGVKRARRSGKVIDLDGVRQPAGLNPGKGAEMSFTGDEMLTAREVAALFGISTRSVTKRIQQGKLKGELAPSRKGGGRSGRLWMVPASEIMAARPGYRWGGKE